jgi:pyruvate dehydrogenase (quinone)
MRWRTVASWRCRLSVTLEMAKGFTSYMVKVVTNGRSDEVIDLDRSNLWR